MSDRKRLDPEASLKRSFREERKRKNLTGNSLSEEIFLTKKI